MSIYCVVCRNEAGCNKAIQLVPCLHIVCTNCFHGFMKSRKVCPAPHCYSQLRLLTDVRWNPCEHEKCIRKLSPVGDVFKASCQHDLCMQCVEEANKRELAACPVRGCGALLNEDEDQEQCEGPCRSMFDVDKLIIMSCCQIRVCESCIKSWSNSNGTCPPGKCSQETERRPRKGKKPEPIIRVPCSGFPDCEGEVLRNFPSEGECEHEVCIGCLARTLEECEYKNTTPICPNEACKLPYRCETVLALRALFPEKASFFSRFDLESHYSMETLKDESVTSVTFSRSDTPLRRIEVKVCFCEDEENQYVVEFEKSGHLGDFLREIRRVLKIMNTDKVYGYFCRGTNGEKQLDLNQKTIFQPLDRLGITKDILILVDITGIVNSKTSNPKVLQ